MCYSYERKVRIETLKNLLLKMRLFFRKDKRFLVVDQMQFILTEPDTKTSGWGIVKFCDFIQDVDVANDKEDSRSLHITIHKPVTNIYAQSSPPILSAKFTFDDHIRCMAAKQNLMKGRQR